MTCIIRVIKGPDTGASCRLQPGTHLIGRSLKASLRLTPTDISYEHATITVTGDDYVVENLSALGTYLDDAKITGPVKLRPRDQLRLSKDTVLRLESEGADAGLLSSRKGIMTLLVLILMVVLGLVIWSVTLEDKPTDDWPHAYNELAPWVSREVAAKRMPADATRLFQNAWRLEQSGDYERSAPLWLRLQMLLESLEDRRAIIAASTAHPKALQEMLNPTPGVASAEPSDEQMSAAFSQFVTRRLAWSSRQSKPKGIMQ